MVSSPVTLWFLEQLLSLYGDGLAEVLKDDPELEKLVKSQKGLKDWKPGDKVPRAVMAAFMAKKMKSAGIDARQPNAAAKLFEALDLDGAVSAVRPAPRRGAPTAQR